MPGKRARPVRREATRKRTYHKQAPRRVAHPTCATRRRIVFLAELGGTGGTFLGLMAYLDPKGDKGR